MSGPVLLVEDDQEFLAGLAQTFSAAGFTPYMADTLARARRYLAVGLAPASAVVDILLPDGFGTELVAELRTAAGPGIHVVACSLFVGFEIVVQAIKSGVDEFVAKPCDPGRVLNAFDDSRATADMAAAIASFACGSLNLAKWEHVTRALERNRGNIRKTAAELGIDRNTLKNIVKKGRPPTEKKRPTIRRLDG